MFYQFILLTVMRGSTVWPQNESSQTLSVPLFNFSSNTNRSRCRFLYVRIVKSPLMMKNCPEWNIIVIQSAKQIDYLVDLKFCTILAIQSPWFQVELIPRIWNCLRFTKLQKFTFEKKLSFLFSFEKQL